MGGEIVEIFSVIFRGARGRFNDRQAAAVSGKGERS